LQYVRHLFFPAYAPLCHLSSFPTRRSSDLLIPFGLFGKSAFMAERVLGNVISSGIKVLVLAVIIGIGSTLFSEFTSGFNGATPRSEEHTSELQSHLNLVCRLLLEKKKTLYIGMMTRFSGMQGEVSSAKIRKDKS